MKNINKVLTSIDWKLLQYQKEKFIQIISERNNREKGTKAMDGILSIIDAIQDAVVADGIKTEGEVFNLSEDKEELEADDIDYSLYMEGFKSIIKPIEINKEMRDMFVKMGCNIEVAGYEEILNFNAGKGLPPIFIYNSQNNEVAAEASAPIEQLCDSTVQGLTAIDLIPGKKYKCVYLPVNSGWRDKESHMHLNGIEFVSLYNAGSDFPAPEFISKETGNLITIDHDSKWEEVNEYPTEVNIIDQAVQQQSAINTIVLIPRIAEHGGYPGNVIKLDIGPNCLVCGKARKIINHGLGLSYDGSRRLSVDCWENECGCTESYQLCREKGLPVPFNTLTINEEPTDVNILGHIDTNLPKSFIHPELQSDWRTGFDKSSKFLTAVEQTSSSPENFRLSITDRNLEITYIYNYDDEKAANVDLTIFDTIMGKSIVEI